MKSHFLVVMGYKRAVSSFYFPTWKFSPPPPFPTPRFSLGCLSWVCQVCHEKLRLHMKFTSVKQKNGGISFHICFKCCISQSYSYSILNITPCENRSLHKPLLLVLLRRDSVPSCESLLHWLSPQLAGLPEDQARVWFIAVTPAPSTRLGWQCKEQSQCFLSKVIIIKDKMTIMGWSLPYESSMSTWSCFITLL